LIPYGHQWISEADIEAVVAVLRSDHITQGPVIDRFERALAEYCGAEHAIAVANGTAALHLACLAMGLGPDDTLWTSPNTFLASANCARYCGAGVDFVDIDPRTYNMDVAALKHKLITAKEAGRLPRAVVPVHFAGQSCDMVPMRDLSREYGFFLLEDACHATGGLYRGNPVGSCEFSDAAVFSFHPVKIITTGEGGMILTNDKGFADRVRLLRTHGITKNPADLRFAPDGPWYYEQIALGYNYRITDLQAALGLSQARRLEEFVDIRNRLAARYDEMLQGLPLSTPYLSEDVRSSFHLYVVRLALAGTAATRRQVFERLISAGVGVQVHYLPVHLQPYYRQLGFSPGDFPVAERYYQECLTLPLFASMSEAEQLFVVEQLKRALP
jgi:UDP-4-amino-4,6-dideoxy-N-acetyl-beta-L-altrosamine transaminase